MPREGDRQGTLKNLLRSVADKTKRADNGDIDWIKSALSHLLKGELIISEDAINAYAEKTSSENRNGPVENVFFTLSEGLIIMKARLRGVSEELTATFVLEQFCFEPNDHSLVFRLKSIEDIRLRGHLGTLLSPIVILIADSVMGRSALLKTVGRVADLKFLSCNDDLIHCELDRIEQFAKVINAEVGVGPFMIKPFNHVRIKEIRIKAGSVLILPGIAQ